MDSVDVDSIDAAAYRTWFRDISPYIVLVEQVGRIDYFCIGSVIQSEDDCTFILTQTNILQSYSDEGAHLSVWFSDGRKQSAVCILQGLEFSILKTEFHPNCKELQFFAGEINFTKAVTIAPFNSTTAYNVKGFVTHKSLKAGGFHSEKTFRDNDHKFAFVCQYGAICPNGISRLLTGPVFNWDRQVLGFVIGDLRDADKSGLEDAAKSDLEDCSERGYMFKTCITTPELERVLADLVPDSDWRRSLKAESQSKKAS